MWLLFALASYTIFASVTITDKYLLSRSIPDARVYAFYTGILGLFAFVFAPLGFKIPSITTMALGIFAGALLIAAMFLFFCALRRGEASRVLVAWGGTVPIFTLLFVYISTKELPTGFEFLALALLIVGSVTILFEGWKKTFQDMKSFFIILLSSFLLSAYFTVAKFLFASEPFLNAFLWIKIGGVLFALLFLISPEVRRLIIQHKKSSSKKPGGIFVLKNGSGGVAALLQAFAVSKASFAEVAIVNALQGVQFAIVFFAALFLTKKFPGIVKERIDRTVIIVKIAGTGLVIAGVALLAITR